MYYWVQLFNHPKQLIKMRKELLDLFPELTYPELEILEHETRDLDAETLRSFAIRYKGRRQDEKIILIMACIGFLGVSGIHRFMVRQPLMGVIYLLTGGLCLIGTIIDIIKYKSLTLEYNHKAMIDTVRELTY